MTDVLLCVGNSMMGDDGAGPLLAEKCAAAPKGNWVVIDGGSAPENDIVAIRETAPDTAAYCRRHGYGAKPWRDPHHRPG
ncbi:hydrogenase 3 maturation protease [Escherichia coli]|uniref:Hydrogenase 3 maturation protease n=1 Tax=Escherichia coli TaxID=562 RepID=A0A377K1X4_ECOLX|nr:hydrogenase 3 maturation protease [Escherichia coli]